ncbi:MAG: hypothetical protein ACM32O_11415 [Clostridia bacterium]
MKRKRWCVLLLLLAVSFSMVIPVAYGSADGQVEMSLDFPLGGIIKYNQWTQVNVTLDNRGETISGHLELAEEEAPSQTKASIRQPFQLQAGETKQISFPIPSETLQQLSPAMMRVVSDGKILVEKKLLRPNFRDSSVIAIIDDNPNAFHFLTSITMDEMQRQRYSIERLKPELVPTESWLLKNVDILAIGNIDSHPFNEYQIEAIKEWVVRGGVLLLYAGEKGSGLLPAFSEQLNLDLTKPAIRTDLGEFLALTRKQTLPADRVKVYDEQKPMFFSKPTGAGILLYANYDIDAEPFASWQYNRDMWQRVFSEHKVLDRLERAYEQFAVDGAALQLSQRMPGVRIPQASWIMLIWAIYILVIAPLLYLVLKRMDRREWTWAIIPAAAILLTLGVYLIGRPFVVKEDSAYSVNLIKILDEKMAEVQSSASFLTVSGGSYEIEAEAGFNAVPIRSHPHGGFVANGEWRREKDDKQWLRFENVPYLSVRQATALGMKDGMGSFENRLSVDQDRISGVVKNQTAYPMDELILQIGKQRISLGVLGPGEQKQVNAKLDRHFLSQSSVRTVKDREKLTEEEKAELMRKAMQFNSSYTVRLVGISSTPLPILQLKQAKDVRYWNVFTQDVKLAPSSTGKIMYPYGTLAADTVKDVGNVYYRDDMWEIENGSLTFSLAVNRAPIHVTKVEIPLDQSVYRPFTKEIFHAKSARWQPIEGDKPLILEQGLDEYLTGEGKLLIRFSNPENTALSMPEPYFQVEGEDDKR